MRVRIAMSVLLAVLVAAVPVRAQEGNSITPRDRDAGPHGGLSLEEALALALAQEPSLRAARTEIDIARGMRLQASRRPNPSVSFERREEPAGTDNQTTVAVEWPLDLFRRSSRVAVADREIDRSALAIADRERLLAAEVRMRYGDAAGALRDLTVVNELVAAARRQFELLRSRVEEGATPPLERDLLDVELRRLEADGLLQTGKAEAALFELKRTVGMPADASLMLRDGLEGLVHREAQPFLDEAAAMADRRADVLEAAARAAVAERKVARARAEGLLDVSVFAGYMRTDAGFPQHGVRADGGLERIRGVFQSVSAGARIMLPLSNRNQGEVAAAVAEYAGARLAHQTAQLAAGAEIGAARARDERARQAVAVSSGARVLARRNFAVVNQSYELGRATVFDVLAEQRRLLELERAHTETLKAAYEARTALDRARGGVR